MGFSRAHTMYAEISGEGGELVEYTFEVDVDVTPGCPGRVSGPPEDCYPPEPAEVEYGDVRCIETGRVFSVDEWELLKRWSTDSDYDISDEDERVLEAVGDAEDAAYEDACEAAYDAWKDEGSVGRPPIPRRRPRRRWC
jgi:hypothetical protein